MDYFDVVPLRRVPWGLGLFTYCHTEPVAVGTLVQCRFSGQLVNAVVWAKQLSAPAGVKVKQIEGVSELDWTTPTQRQLLDWASKHYATPLPTLLYLYGLAPVQRVSKKLGMAFAEPVATPATWAELSSLVVEVGPADDAQAAAEVALAWAEHGQPTLILCPTLSDVQRVSRMSGGLAYSLDLPRTTRTAVWRSVIAGNAKVVVGTAASAFLPFEKLGGVVVYRESDPAAKAVESRPLLHLATVAQQLGSIHSCPVGMVDFSPSIQSAYLAQTQNVRVVRRGNTSYSENLTLSQPPLLTSPQFVEKIAEATARDERTLVLVPRLGEAGLLRCSDCAFTFTCSTCNRSLQVSSSRDLRCSFCGATQPMPTSCPNCHGSNLRERQWTVARVAQQLSKLVPYAAVATFDASGTEIPSAPIVVSTTAALYQLDLASFSWRVAIDFDVILQQPSLDGTSRAYRMLRQLCAAGPTAVETRAPEHRVFATLDRWSDFARAELAERRRFNLLPATPTLKLSVDGGSRAEVMDFAAKLERALGSTPSLKLVSSAASPGRSLHRRFRHVAIVQAKDPAQLELIHGVDYSHWTADPDPVDFT